MTICEKVDSAVILAGTRGRPARPQGHVGRCPGLDHQHVGTNAQALDDIDASVDVEGVGPCRAGDGVVGENAVEVERGLLHRNPGAIDPESGAVILGPEGLKPLGRKGHLKQQQSEVLPLIARGFLTFQHTIEVVTEFLGENGDGLLLTGLLQPIGVQVDRARGAAIGACRGRHAAAGQQPDLGQA